MITCMGEEILLVINNVFPGPQLDSVKIMYSGYTKRYKYLWGVSRGVRFVLTMAGGGRSYDIIFSFGATLQRHVFCHWLRH